MNLKETNAVIIELIDTYVNFLLPELKDKGINVKFNVDKEADSLEHGTMMASIINAKLSSNCLTEKEAPCGVAPLSFIRSYSSLINFESVAAAKMILDEPDHSLPAGIIGPLVKKHHTKSMPIIINLSGGQISNATYVRTEWNNIVSKLCKQSSYDVLIISSAGNEGIYLTKDNIMEYGILPSTTKPKSCKNDIPIISVGGTNKYNKVLKISPDVYKHGNKGSNYGRAIA